MRSRRGAAAGLAMREATPLVSIGLPTYNRAEFLRHTLDSLLRQSYSHLQILVSDDASTDHTRAVVEEAMVRDPRVRYHRYERNQGAIRNCEFVIEHAEGPYFLLMNDDDIAAPGFVARLMQELQADPNVHLAFCDFDVIDNAYQVIGRVRLEALRPDIRWRDAQLDFWSFPYTTAAIAVNGLGLTAAVKRVRRPFSNTPRNMISGHEATYLAQIAMRGRIVTVPEVLFSRMVHRQTKSSLTQASSTGLSRADLALLYGAIWCRLAWYAVRADVAIPQRLRLLGAMVRAAGRKLASRR